MTRKLLTLSIFFLFFIGLANAQCTPDNGITKPGFYPATLPDATVNVAYNEIIQFKIIKDTTVIVFGSQQKAIIDSARILKVIGLPNGIGFDLNKTSQTYTPSEVGCAKVSGTCNTAGTYKLGIILTLYAKVSGFPVNQTDTIKNFSINVNGSSFIKNVKTTTNLIYPNPLSDNQLSLNLSSEDLTLLQNNNPINIYNPAGKLIQSKLLDNNEGHILFDKAPGIYYLSYTLGENTYWSKFIKN